MVSSRKRATSSGIRQGIAVVAADHAAARDAPRRARRLTPRPAPGSPGDDDSRRPRSPRSRSRRSKPGGAAGSSVGIGVRVAAELRLDLLAVVVVDVAVAAGPDQVADVEVALLREHVREQRVARDVERDAEEDVGAALVDLAAERSRHRRRRRRGTGRARGTAAAPSRGRSATFQALTMMRRESGSSCSSRTTSAIWSMWPAVRGRPAAPLHAVDRAEVAVVVGPFVPDRDAALLQPATLLSPRRNQSNSYAIDGKCTFFVVTSGNPSARSKRIW